MACQDMTFQDNRSIGLCKNYTEVTRLTYLVPKGHSGSRFCPHSRTWPINLNRSESLKHGLEAMVISSDMFCQLHSSKLTSFVAFATWVNFLHWWVWSHHHPSHLAVSCCVGSIYCEDDLFALISVSPPFNPIGCILMHAHSAAWLLATT